MGRVVTGAIIAIALAVGIYIGANYKKSFTDNPNPTSTAAPMAQPVQPAPSPLLPPQPSVPRPQPQALFKTQAPTAVPIDPFTDRKLNLPLPKKIQDILDSPVEYVDPELPGRPGTIDGSVFTTYRGHYEAAPGKFRQVSLTNGSGSVRSLQLETLKGEIKEWRSEYQDFTVSNFNGDPYSIVFHLRTGRMIYLKYYDNHTVPDYHETNFRSMRGWLIENNTARKIAMIDGFNSELEDLKQKNKFVWPALGSIRQLMPGDLN